MTGAKEYFLKLSEQTYESLPETCGKQLHKLFTLLQD